MTNANEDGGVRAGQGVLRDLGLGERIISLHSEGRPMHFCMVCELAGPTAAGDYQAAFDRVRVRHPLLAASIEPGAPGRIRRSARTIPVSVLSRAEAPDWERVVERELSTPFDDREGPLMRATVLHEPERATIVLCFHHALADGLSGVYVVADLVRALAGAPLDAPRDLMKALETYTADLWPASKVPREVAMPPGLDDDVLRSIAASPMWVPFAERDVRVSRLAFDRDTTSRWRRHSKAQGTTLHGALSAAIAVSSLQRSGTDFKLSHAVNMRTILCPDNRECGLLVAYIVTTVPAPSASGFWDVARRTMEGVQPFRSQAGITSFLHIAKACVPDTGDQALASGFLGLLPLDASITNLGDLPIPVDVGRLRLDAVWGPLVVVGRRDEVMIGATGLDGELRLVQTSPRHVAPVLHEIGDALDAACSRAG